MLQFNHLSKIYENGQVVLNNVDFCLSDGEMAFLTGHSGAGKSTLLELIARIKSPSSGEIEVNRFNLNRMRGRDLPLFRRSLGIVFQTPYLLDNRSVFDNVALPLMIAGLRRHEIQKRVLAALDKVGLLGKENQKTVALSGGEQQRVGIARAVIHKPQLLIADEPTGNLDPALSLEIMDLLTRFNRVGVSVLVATHDLALIAQMRYRIICLQSGTLTG